MKRHYEIYASPRLSKEREFATFGYCHSKQEYQEGQEPSNPSESDESWRHTDREQIQERGSYGIYK
jgi:hypothetical protein